MKFLKIVCPFFILLVSCNEYAKEANAKTLIMENKTTNTLEGTWELTGYYNYKDNQIIDSFNTNEGYRQIKMYTPTKVMWSKEVPADSTEWYGYGTYSISDSRLTEVLEYGSASMKKIIENKKEFVFELILKERTYIQIEIDEEGNRIYSENYRKIE